MPRRFKKLVLTILIFLIGCFLWWTWATAPVDKHSSTAQIFVIPKGQGIDDIAKNLKQAGLIRSPVAFKIYVIKSGLTSKIQAGDFRLKPSMDLSALTQELTHGTLDIWVTLPEGYRREQIAAKLNQEFTSRGAEFDSAQFLQLTHDQEGYLFPDTYLIPRDASVKDIADLLNQTFNIKVDLSSNQTNLTEKEIIILASIVEREAQGSDRQDIANILFKRLKNNIGLNADATLQYALGTPNNWWPTPTAKDKLINSPYNTYKYQGLPPSPIANPGLSSVQAVLNVQDTLYLYYLHDPKGQIHLAKTLAEHQVNIRLYLNP